MLLLAFCFSSPVIAHTKNSWIIDTDLGVDDAIALVYFLNQPDIRVNAIAIESDGNAHCKPAFINMHYLLKLRGHADIPVACGRAMPLRGKHHYPLAMLSNADTFAGLSLNKPSVTVPRQTAKELLIKTLESSSNPQNILALGPLTTLAEVLTSRPDLKNKIQHIYIMGGAVYVPGNVHAVAPTINNYAAEWNIYIDPYAAKKVFQSGIAITLVPLDVTNQVTLDLAFYERIKQQQHTPATKFIYQLLHRNQQMLSNHQWYFWDPMAAVIAAHENIATMKVVLLSVRLQPESLAGATVVDKRDGSLIHVCVGIDKEKFKDILLAGF